MNYVTKIFLLAFLTICMLANKAHAQDNVTLMNKYIVQPDVWHFARPTAPGVDAYGDLNLALPIMTVPGRGLEYEIKFNYRSGIKYSQRATWIGLGWSFDPGSITRVVEGGAKEVIERYPGDYAHTGHGYGVDIFESDSRPPAQPDVYYVTLPGHGTVAMSRSNNTSFDPNTVPDVGNGTFVIHEHTPWKIETRVNGPVQVGNYITGVDAQSRSNDFTTKSDINSFIITVENGTRYVFAKPTLSFFDTPNTKTEGGSIRQYFVNTWRLVAILAPDFSDAVPEDLSSPWPAIDAPGKWIRFDYRTLEEAADVAGPDVREKITQTRYLKAIQTPTHRAKFYTFNRIGPFITGYEDLNNELYRKLGHIRLFYDGTRIKTIDLLHSNSLTPQGASGIRRLALDGIDIFGRYGSTTNGYQFQYNFNPSFTILSGGDHQRCYDDFGYYSQGHFVGHGCPDQLTDTNGGRAWSLTSIKYPTGGKAEFVYVNDKINDDSLAYNWAKTTDEFYYRIYQGNRSRQGGTRVKTITWDDGRSNISTTNYEYGEGHLSGIPSIYLRDQASMQTDHIRYYAAANRGKVAVAYEWVKEIRADESYIKRYYTNVEEATYAHGGINRIQTVRFLGDTHFRELPSDGIVTGCPTQIGVECQDFAILQGNQHWNWGELYLTEYYPSSGSRVKRVFKDMVVHASPGNPTLANVWNFEGLPQVKVEYGDVKVNSISYSKDGVTKTKGLSYDSRTGLIQESYVAGEGKSRIKSNTFAFDIYSGMQDRNMLSQLARTDISSAPNDYGGGPRTFHAANVTTWHRPGTHSFWKPRKKYSWKATSSSSTKQSFTNWTSGTPGNEWERKTTFASYDAHGHEIRQIDGRGSDIFFYYGVNDEAGNGNYCGNDYLACSGYTGMHNAYLTGVAFGAEAGPVRYKYDYNLQFGAAITQIEDDNSSSRSFLYDNFGRLSQIRNDKGDLVESYSYHFTNGDVWNDPSYTQTSFFQDGSTTEIVTQFLDGLGRTIQTQKRVGAEDVITATEYDELGRKWKSWKPFTQDVNHAYDPSYGSHASAYYDGSPGADANARPYMETLYASDPLDRISKTLNPGVTGGVGEEMHYKTRPIGGVNRRFTEIIDESGDITRSYIDDFGNVIREAHVREGEVLEYHTVSVSASAGGLQLLGGTQAGTGIASSSFAVGPDSADTQLQESSTNTADLSSPSETEDIDIDEFTPPMNQTVNWSANLSTLVPSGSIAIPNSYFKIYVQGGESSPIVSEYCSGNGCSENPSGSFPATGGVTYVLETGASMIKDDNGSASAEGSATYSEWVVQTTEVATTFDHDARGNITKVTQPEGQEITYVYNTLGQLAQKTTPDGGTIGYKYNQAGNVRFSQTAVQSAAEKIYSTTYDELGRPYRSGEYKLMHFGVQTFGELDATRDPYPLEEDFTLLPNWLTIRAYDEKPATEPWDWPWDKFDSQIAPLNLTFTKGRLTGTLQKSNGKYQATLFSYDREGRVETKYIFTEGEGDLNTQIDYEYDRQGNITKRSITVGSTDFYYWYDYNQRGLLEKVYASSNDSKPSQEEAAYTYAPDGQVSEVDMNGSSAHMRSYNARGELTDINDVDGPINDFALRYSYTADGNVGEVEVFTLNPAVEEQDHYRYTYSYDGLDRLTSADYDYWGPTGIMYWTDSYGLENVSYDGNGNLLNLRRRGAGESAVDNLSYSYDPGTNRIDYITDAANAGSIYWDVEDGPFTYDHSGRMLAAPAPQGLGSIDYDERGLPIGMTRYANLKYTGYENGSSEWRRDYASNQSYSTAEAYSGERSWKVVAVSACCDYMTYEQFNPYELDEQATYVFSAWVKAQAGHTKPHIQLKYKDGSGWHYPPRDSYSGSGKWERLEVRLDLSQVQNLQEIEATTRNGGSSGIAAYWDEVRFYKAREELRYRYTASGHRYWKKTAGGATYYALDGSATLGVFEANGTLKHWNIVLPSGEVVGRSLQGGGRRYYLKDRLGSVRVVVNGNGTITEARDYYPFGLRMPGRSTTSSETNEQYTGHEWDTASELLYAGARYYMPAYGRWMTRDPILNEKLPKVLQEKDVRYLSMSPYNYVHNNPTYYVDPDGKQVAAEVYQNARIQSRTGVSLQQNYGTIDLAAARDYAVENRAVVDQFSNSADMATLTFGTLTLGSAAYGFAPGVAAGLPMTTAAAGLSASSEAIGLGLAMIDPNANQPEKILRAYSVILSLTGGHAAKLALRKFIMKELAKAGMTLETREQLVDPLLNQVDPAKRLTDDMAEDQSSEPSDNGTEWCPPSEGSCN